MSVLNVNLTDLRGLSKKNARETFETWAREHLPKSSMLSFEGGKEKIAGVERQWKVVSFGDYRDAYGRYRRFVSYRCGFGSLSRVYSWVWDAGKNDWMECDMQGFGSW